MKKKTAWKKWKLNPLVGKRLFNEEIGSFKITRVEKCKEYCQHAELPSGSHWFPVERAYVITDKGFKYVLPYLGILLNSVDENGKRI